LTWRFGSKPPDDAVAHLADGRVVRIRYGMSTWDDVPHDAKVDSLRVGEETLRGYERYFFDFEAISTMPSGNPGKRPVHAGTVVAMRGVGAKGDTTEVVRVTRKGGRVSRFQAPASRFAPHVWREGVTL